MEEIVTTEALEREILEDARKKAAALLKGADEAAAKLAAASSAKTADAVAVFERDAAARVARHESESAARLPLEKSRIRTAYLDEAVRAAVDRFFASLPESRVVELASSMTDRAEEFLKGRELVARACGFSEAAREAFARSIPWAASARVADDPTVGSTGAVVEDSDATVVVRATMDVLASELLREKRAELADALCGKAART